MPNFEKQALNVLDHDEEITTCETASYKLFHEMPEADKQDFLIKAHQRFTKEQLAVMYNLTEEEVETYLKEKTSHSDKQQEQEHAGEGQEVNELPAPVTSEYVHAVATELVYPLGITSNLGLSKDVLSLIRSVCSMADYYHKPYAQIAFANGTGIFTYKKQKGEYIPSLVIHPDVVDDLVH